MQRISRKEAKDKGLKRYFTGEPCRNGHICERRVDNNRCIECRKTTLRKYDQSEKGKKSKKRNYSNWYISEKGQRNIFLKRLKSYHLTENDYYKMIEGQDNKCAICKIIFNSLNKRTKICIDHNHLTNEVRGLLCTICNSLIGFVNESIPVLEKCIRYLEKHKNVQETDRKVITNAAVNFSFDERLKDKIRKLKNNYKLSYDDYQLMLLNQNNSCVICDTLFCDKPHTLTSPCVDHNHISGKVRDILCFNCNSIIGFSREQKIILERAINYLIKYNK